mmetsp:Transcript_15658/g.29540  ORF Transcript_15658/g.29540 Transcript_15658/m.29540 type:complete len:96 (-) Transcript_15658:1294-1581(-)
MNSSTSGILWFHTFEIKRLLQLQDEYHHISLEKRNQSAKYASDEVSVDLPCTNACHHSYKHSVGNIWYCWDLPQVQHKKRQQFLYIQDDNSSTFP